MPHIEFDRYYKYIELTQSLQTFASEFPNLVELVSIGKSFEGRDIWLLEVTNKETGPAIEKPAFWCDGNIHASEVSASTAVLHLLNKLCAGYGSRDDVTLALDTRAFYLVPRLNPDGAEWSLETPPRVVRSSTRRYPYEEEDLEGLERKDIDGDGRILSMRIKDPNGAWKCHPDEPRLMVRRDPTEVGGEYYRLVPEGILHNWDGILIRPKRIAEGLDLNRNFPSAWRFESEQHGAGPFPASEPEIHAVVQAIVARPNITGAIAFHTFSGVHLRPSSRYGDSELPAEDLWVFQTFGKKGTEITGYPAISTYEEFRYHPKEVITGVFDDWMYEHRGVYPWVTEIWSPQRQAGITDYKYIDWFREHPVEDDLKMLRWSDEKLGGLGHIDWKEFDHPQLGKVEIGGWDAHYAFRNPPPPFLESEVSPLGDWAIWQALCSPLLLEREFRIEGNRVRFAVQNAGWLPTNVTEIAKKNKLCRGIIAELERIGEPVPSTGSMAPMWLQAGRLFEERGQLLGRSHISAGGFGNPVNPTDDVEVFSWVLGAGKYRATIRHDRAGVVRREFEI